MITATVSGLSVRRGVAADADRPNFVWVMSEDNSADYLRHFDRHGAPAPNIEAMAQHGVTFDRAFSCAPVCSVARTTLITSCYAPRIGTQFHRRMKMVPMPPVVEMFPAYLREAGYYTTNNSKEDYNAIKSANVWNESSKRASWKNRPDAAAPFFHVQTTTLSHESSLHFSADELEDATVTQPVSVQLQPYFPDTNVFRRTRARYHDRMMAIDRVVGQVVDELAEAGELENTYVFYFGDHGGVLPRSKGYAYESGLHVPLVIRVPDNFRMRVGRDDGTRTEGFVEFVDFGPTVLRLAGIDAPSGIDGKAFLGEGVDPTEVDGRQEAIGYADRFDEKYDLVRTLRQGRWKYIRNFEPFYPDALQNNYRYKMLAYEQWRQMHREGKLNEVQDQFFRTKPVEALFDLESDPHEIHNLAGEAEHAERLRAMRRRLTERLKGMPDLSFLPEAILIDVALENPVAFGQQHQQAIAELIDTVNLALLPFDEAKPQLEAALGSGDPWVRYWAVVACSSFADRAASLLPLVQKRLVDFEPLVAMRAAEFVAIAGKDDPRPTLYRSIQRATSPAEVLPMLNTAVFFDDSGEERLQIDPDKIDFLFSPDPNGEVMRRIQYLSQ